MRSDTSEGRPVTVKVLLRHGLLRVILVFMVVAVLDMRKTYPPA
jgi:hypothetical protein